MKRKATALMTALTLAVGLSACGDNTSVSADASDLTGAKEIAVEAEETEEDIARREIEKIQAALGGMPYYGDVSNCKMTAEQAAAYAQLIADGLAGDFNFRGGYGERFDILTWEEPFQLIDIEKGDIMERNRDHILLADFSGDGIPYLYLSSSINDEYQQSYEIYGWADQEAKLVIDTDAEYSSIAWKEYGFYEDENKPYKVNMTVHSGWGLGESFVIYSFADGTMEEHYGLSGIYTEDGLMQIQENGVESGVCAEQEFYAMLEEQENRLSGPDHIHTLPYPCFYDMTPCTLEEMIDYLNAYAAVMSDGESVPVKIRSAEIVRHDGTGIITKGEVPEWKVEVLELLRQYMNGTLLIASGNADSSMYTPGTEFFYFGFKDINDDGTRELLVSYRQGDSGPVQIHVPPSYECLMNVYGFDSTNGTWLVSEGSVCTIEHLYQFDGTSFSRLSTIEGDWSTEENGPYTQTEDGVTREISDDEFYRIMNDWDSRHTRISPESADILLNIENVEKTFQVKINTRNSGEWLVTGAE